MRYELTDLRLFLAIAEAKSLSGGANTVHLTASSASYRLKNLEFAMGVPLFKREARGMELTPEGDFVLKHVRSLLAGVERMHGEVSGFASGLKGSVKLFANSSSLNGFIVPSLSRFLSANPNVNILLEERSSTTIEAAIAGHEADIGIFAGNATSAGVNAVRYAIDQLIIAAPLNHPIVESSPVRFPAVLDLDFVCMSRTSSNYVFLRDMAKLAGKTPKVRIHVHTFDAVLSMVEAGVGVSLVPRSIASAALREGRIAAVDLSEPWALRELTLVTQAGVPPSPFVEQVAGYLLDDPIVAATRGPD
ncbi:HTH-type transcriptional regulator GltC [compost metagenome]|jgi:DNA-binding transcriptional LysR family regulator|uniref:LysR family transcriptional regulator n=1 Tax=Achromobacter sp. Root83 TaxID=1736602 RepID=UPI00070D1451|nr:LysR family transcriptional regulator [Achromobacter sp. Root83]KRC70073.1 LysR family transcriptional regulator [Achromobacter sp. Root83]